MESFESTARVAPVALGQTGGSVSSLVLVSPPARLTREKRMSERKPIQRKVRFGNRGRCYGRRSEALGTHREQSGELALHDGAVDPRSAGRKG